MNKLRDRWNTVDVRRISSGDDASNEISLSSAADRPSMDTLRNINQEKKLDFR